MKKVGLLLRVEPNSGGTYQYTQSIIDAFTDLPRDKFSTVVGYASTSWIPILDNYDINKRYIPPGIWGKDFCKVLSLLMSAGGLWRKASPYFHPVAQALIEEKCDLWVFPSQDAWSYQIPVPALVTIHDLMHRYERRFPEVSAKGEYFRRELHYRYSCKWARGVIVDSEIGKRHVMDSYGMEPERIYVLPYVPPQYIHSQTGAADFDVRYKLPPKYIFYPAQFWRHKNHERLIMAVKTLKHELPDLKLVLAGAKKNGHAAALQLVHESNLDDDVIFLGFVPDKDMPELYKRARALVMPTFFGPTNIPPLEALALKCPVAVSGIYAMPEQLGDAALFFNPESVEEIRECIKKLWIDDALCSRLVSRGTERAALFQQKNFSENFRHIVEQILVQPLRQQVKPSPNDTQ